MFPAPFGLDSLAFELPLSLLAVLTVAAVFGNEVVRFWAIRLFAGPPTPAVRERLSALVAAGSGFALLIYGFRDSHS
jgi:hypothetical protein